MKVRVFGLLAVAAGCASGGAPPGMSAGPETATMQTAPSVYSLLGDRDRLGLTSAQVAALDSIGEWLIDANSEANEQLRELGVVGGLQGPGRRQRIPDEAGPVLAELRENNRRAMEGIGEVLTVEQRAQVCEDGRQRGRRGGRDEQPRPGMRRSLPDSVMAMPVGRWSWCAPGPAVPDSGR